MDIIPGLDLDHDMYELAAAGIAEHAPDLDRLTWERFTDPHDWLLIPDLDGEISKAELTLKVVPDQTPVPGFVGDRKLNVWFRPDIRGGAEEQIPHNHRWSVFHSHLLRGAYSELRYRRASIDPETGTADVVIEPSALHATPEVNAVAHDVFHEVDWCEPGTMSLMVCGPGRFGDWCHLDVATGQTRHDQPVASFNAAFAALNPHRPDLH